MWMVRQRCFLNAQTVKSPFATRCPKSQRAGPWVAWHIMALALSRRPESNWVCPSDLSSCLLLDVYLEGCRKVKTAQLSTDDGLKCNFGSCSWQAPCQDGGWRLIGNLSGYSFFYRNFYKPRMSSNRRDLTFPHHTKGTGSSSLRFMPKMKIFTIIKWLQQLWSFWSPHWNLLVIFNFEGWEFSLTGISLIFFHHGPWMRHTK